MRSRQRSPGIAGLLLAGSVLFGWSDPALVAHKKCRGGYSVEQLQRYLPKARVTLWLPGTRTVGLDSEQRCLLVTVDDFGGWRLAQLVLRGVSVPRRAVQVQVVPSPM